MADTDEVQSKKASDILKSAKQSIEKARAEALQNTLKEKWKKRSEHTRAIAQIDEEIEREIAAYEDGQ